MMAELLQVGKSMDKGSDTESEHCVPCYELTGDIKPVVGYCIDCDDSLCIECFNSHLRPKPSRNHQLKEKDSTVQSIRQQQQKARLGSKKSSKLCFQHHGEVIQSFCTSHNQLCCLVCLTINHPGCDTEDISKVAANIKESKELKDIGKILNELENDFNENLSKTGAHEHTIQNNCSNAVNDMTKLRDKFESLMTETENQAEKVKEEDFKKVESISKTCTIVVDQIKKIKAIIEISDEDCDEESLFISMKQGESQISSLEESLAKVNKDNTVREYTFKIDEKVNVLMTELKVLGHLAFSVTSIDTTAVSGTVSKSEQRAKTPAHLVDINVESTSCVYGAVSLPKNRALITECLSKSVKQIDFNQNKVKTKLVLSGNPFDITMVNADLVAVTLCSIHKVQMVSMSGNTLTMGNEISVQGDCRGIAYNSKDKTFVVTFISPPKVEIIDMTGTVIRSIHKDKDGNQLFSCPCYVALCPDMSGMYVTDAGKHSVTLLTWQGEVTAVYKNGELKGPRGIYVHKSGLVYVVGSSPGTVHQLDLDNGEFKLLDMKDKLANPYSVSYCESEDRMLIGAENSGIVKVFQMK